MSVKMSFMELYGYLSYGSGHYTFEIVRDMSIWIDKTYHMSRLINWFGSYSKTIVFMHNSG